MTKNYVFDVSDAREIAEPFVNNLQQHIPRHTQLDVNAVLNQWFIQRLADMKLIAYDNGVENHMPLEAAVFLDGLPAVIRGSIDEALYRTVQHYWHPETEVQTQLRADALLIRA